MDPSAEKRRSTAKPPPLEGFQTQYDGLLSAYFAAEARVEDVPPVDGSRTVSREQRMMELQSQMGHLCAMNDELRLALDHFETIRAWVEAHESGEVSSADSGDNAAQEPTETEPKPDENGPEEETVAEELRVVLAELKINALTNQATIYSRLGDENMAMSLLQSAKKAMRELKETPQSTARVAEMKRQEIVLTANYSALLQSQGVLGDAAVAAENVLDLAGPLPRKKTKTQGQGQVCASVDAARLTAAGVLASCMRSKGDSHKAHELSLQAAQALKLGHAGQDALLLARTENNVGLDCYETRDFTNALAHFLAAYRACMLDQKMSDRALQDRVVFHVGRCLAELGTTAVLPSGGDSTQPMTAADCFMQVQQTASTRSIDKVQLTVLVQACLGELSFHNGDFVTAESQLLKALAMLAEASDAEISQGDRIKIQGYVESYLGSSLLANGQLGAAEEAHQRDLELALDTEDLLAQLRALRNLALLYSTTQRFVEGITLWRETLEIAAVLESKRDLVIGYGGLGAALKALAVVDFNKNEYQEFLSAAENKLRPIFIKQRTLAMELGDDKQQVLAQRQLVGTYEWQPQVDELEQRLEECDTFVRLSEQLGNPQYRADSYRALANAITVQIARLAERGQRFAEAIRVLKFKRNVYLQKLRDAMKAPYARATPARLAHDRIEFML